MQTMQSASLADIEAAALDQSNKGLKWHFHMLSADCTLNEKDQCSFILERSGKPVLVHYFNTMEMGLRNKLLPLLHGNDVMEARSTEKDYRPSKVIQEIVARAKALNDRRIAWHHHVLFPDCIFNRRSPKWVLMLEDKQ